MDYIKNILIATIVAIVVVLGASIFKPSPSTPPFGALAGPDIASQYLAWGGVAEYRFSQTMTTGASTTCSFVTPAATTSLQFAIARFTSASSTAAIDAEWGKGAIDATTTSLGQVSSIAAATPATFTSSSTGSGVDVAATFGPSTRLNLKIGSVGAGASPSGTCVAGFIIIP